jgi:hypothetical protein
LTYNPLILTGVSVTNGPVISTATVTFVQGIFDNANGKLGLTLANSEDKSAGYPYPRLNNTGPGILATVVFDVVSGGIGETDIMLSDIDTQLKRSDGTNIVDGYFNPNQLGHGYFRNEPLPIAHDVATTGLAFHLPIAVVSTYNGTTNWTYIDATIENQGDVLERFNVKISYVQGSFPIVLKEETVIVPGGGATIVSARFNASWLIKNNGNVTDPNIFVPTGYLPIKVEASTVDFETQTIDNTYNTTLLVKMTGDIQGDSVGTPGDCDVDAYDFGTFAFHYGQHYPAAKYNAECDFNRDGRIDADDFGDLAFWYGKSALVVPYPTL